MSIINIVIFTICYYEIRERSNPYVSALYDTYCRNYYETNGNVSDP